MDGIINVYKESGFTSHDVVAKLRGILHFKKIGHTGTLDPEALGVLPVCVGKATKVCDVLTDRDKTYRAVAKLGVTTDTLDLTGEILSRETVDVPEHRIREVLGQFVGTIQQIPPMYSAIKINGKKLYELARQGKEVERAPRTVTIHEIRFLDYSEKESEVSFEVTCSKGTYIRTLCDDIGKKLGCGCAMKSLIRTRVGQFKVEDALTLSQIEAMTKEQRLDAFVRPIDSVFTDYISCHVIESGMKKLINGNYLDIRDCECPVDQTLQDGQKVRIYGNDGEFYALYQFDAKKKQYRIVKNFH